MTDSLSNEELAQMATDKAQEAKTTIINHYHQKPETFVVLGAVAVGFVLTRRKLNKSLDLLEKLHSAL